MKLVMSENIRLLKSDKSDFRAPAIHALDVDGRGRPSHDD